MNQTFWDDHYSTADKIWSDDPNPVLVAEVSDLTPGRALDLGCGEGADARWLATRGWQVTATDISQVAIDRAASLGDSDAITWVRGDPLADPPPAASFDLVSMQYFHTIPREGGEGIARSIANAVVPGGTLLMVSHQIPHDPNHQWKGIDPRDFYEPHDVALILGDEWEILIDRTQPRTTPPPGDSHHSHDTVLKAVRLVR
jgi:SAM-dependent methyltransferase